mmetsp:Transcript_15178/g.17866  ORF Transcript_15178/g.17866 Transcript_15178/m.17866 type:complete len:230 (+) Transcript_15178:152-841(+)
MKSYSSGEEKKSVTDIDTEKEAETVVNSQVLEAEVELPSRTKTLHSLSDQTRTEKLDREIENGLLDDCGDNDNDVLICRKMESVLDYDNLIGSGSTEAINHDHDRNDVIYSDEVDDASVNENSKEENSQEGNDGNGETEEKARMKLPKQLSIVRRGEESSDSASNNSTVQVHRRVKRVIMIMTTIRDHNTTISVRSIPNFRRSHSYSNFNIVTGQLNGVELVQVTETLT